MAGAGAGGQNGRNRTGGANVMLGLESLLIRSLIVGTGERRVNRYDVSPATVRVTVNLFAGNHDEREVDLMRGRKGRNRTGGVNMMVRIAPNVAMGGNEESL